MNQRDQIKRQINAAKDYLRRLHPRFEEERKQREEWIQEKEAELMKLEKENGAISTQLEPCPFCGSMPKIENRTVWCDWQECYVRPNIYCESPEMLPKLWNQMAMMESEDEKQESQKETSKMSGPFNPCAKCGSPVEWQISFSRGDEGFVKCPRCGNGITFKNGDFSSVDEVAEKWNQVNTKPERRTEMPVGPNELNPCARCGVVPDSPTMMFTCDDEVFISCRSCGRGVFQVKRDNAVDDWNKLNPLPDNSDQNENESDNTERIFPDENSLMLKIKLSLLNSILGLQRDAVGPVIEVKEIQETLVEIVKAIHDGVKWDKLEPIKKLAGETEKMKKDPYLIPSEKKNISIRGSVYVTELHIARAVCQEAEMLVWKYEQKNGIGGMTAIPEYLYQLSEWLFVRAEYLRETEECC